VAELLIVICRYIIQSVQLAIHVGTRCKMQHIHTYILFMRLNKKFITRCIVEDGSNQRRGLLLGGGVYEEMEEK